MDRAGTPVLEESQLQRNERWFVVSTQPSAELKTCSNLQRQGWRTYFPKISRTVRSGRRTSTELRPLFAGYVFVALDLRRDAWRSVDGTLGARALVKSGDVPSPTPLGLVESLMELSDEYGRLTFSHRLKAGSQVRFLTGPFAELTGSLERLDSRGRVMVLLTLLGRQTEVRASASELMPVA
jgi:transcriptional antiterminator RfaH